MFERFTDAARMVIVLAQEEARLLNHDYIGTEHIVLAMTRVPENLAYALLAAHELTSEQLRQMVEDIVGRGAQPSMGHIPFTPRSKKVLEHALRESNGLGHNWLGPEHILLGLIREPESTGAKVLIQAGINLELLRQEMLEVIRQAMGATQPGRVSPGSLLYLLRGRYRLQVDVFATLPVPDDWNETPTAYRNLRAAQEVVKSQSDEVIVAMFAEACANEPAVLQRPPLSEKYIESFRAELAAILTS